MTPTSKYMFFGTGNGAMYFTNQAQQHFKLFVGPNGSVTVRPVSVYAATEEQMDEALDLTLVVRGFEDPRGPSADMSEAWNRIVSL